MKRELNIHIRDLKVEITPPKIIGLFAWMIAGYLSGMIWSDYISSEITQTHWTNVWVYFWLFLWPFGWFWHLILPIIVVAVVAAIGAAVVYLLWDSYGDRVRSWNVGRMCRNVLRRNKP